MATVTCARADTTPHDRDVAASLEAMRGRHLGRCARRILLLAPGPTEEPLALPPERDGRAAAESHRRAVRRLGEIGLVELSWKAERVQTKRRKQASSLSWDSTDGVYHDGPSGRIPVERAVDKRAVRLTPLGALVVDLLRHRLESGDRIRWSTIIEPCP